MASSVTRRTHRQLLTHGAARPCPRHQQAGRTRVAPCRALYMDPVLMINDKIHALEQLASEELVLESNLHASSLTVMQCLASYGLPQQAPSLVDHRVLNASTAGVRAGSPIAALLGAVREDNEANLAVCLASPSTDHSEEGPRRIASRGFRVEAQQEDTNLDMMLQESSSGAQPSRSVLTRLRRSRSAEALLKLGAMLPACPLTGRRLVSMVQA